MNQQCQGFIPSNVSAMNERSRSENSSNDLSMSSIGSPTAASSPTCKQRNPVNQNLNILRTLTINFQSIKKQGARFTCTNRLHNHVITGKETWLTKDMQDYSTTCYNWNRNMVHQGHARLCSTTCYNWNRNMAH